MFRLHVCLDGRMKDSVSMQTWSSNGQSHWGDVNLSEIIHYRGNTRRKEECGGKAEQMKAITGKKNITLK